MKSRLLLVLCFVLSSLLSEAQNRYVVYLTDKNNSPFSLSNPQQFLSQRAITRRLNHNIALDNTDLPANPSYVQGISTIGVSVLNVSKWLNAVIIESASQSALNAVSQLPYVSGMRNIGKPAPGSDNLPNKFTSEQAGPLKENAITALRTTSFNYGQASNQADMIGLPVLHNLGFAGENMLIAVLDAGFFMADQMTCFDSIFNNNQIITTWDFVDHESDVFDDDTHGSSVLSCMAANVPGDMVGTAPHANYILLRSEDATSENIIEEYNWSVAAEFADSMGCDLITSSLGYTRFDDPAQDHVYADMDGDHCPSTIAADIAASKGIFVNVSAGNEGSNSWNYISAPSDGDSVQAVGAVDEFSSYALFSGNGPSADGRVKPDVAAQGQNTTLYSPFGGNTPTQGNGTSFSGPIMAGASACLWQAWPSFSNMDIMAAIRRSASQFLNPDTLLGYGIPNFGLANNLLGLGNINVPTSAPLHIYPNPSTSITGTHLLYFSDTSQEIRMVISDASGRTITDEVRTINGYGYSDLPVNAVLASGVYTVKIEGKRGEIFGRFIRR